MAAELRGQRAVFGRAHTRQESANSGRKAVSPSCWMRFTLVSDDGWHRNTARRIFWCEKRRRKPSLMENEMSTSVLKGRAPDRRRGKPASAMSGKTGRRLAIDGGLPAVRDKLPHWPEFDPSGIKAVEEVLRSGKVNYWTGHKGMEFERKFSEWQGSKFSVSATNGTAALHVGLTALGIGPGTK